jgi:hypothetical protein
LKILLDHNVDRRFIRHLPGHDVQTTRQMRWEELSNGQLIQAAATTGFDVMLSVDKNLRHEQNLDKLPLPIIVLDSASNALPYLIPFATPTLELLKQPLQKAIYLIGPDGSIVQHGSPE